MVALVTATADGYDYEIVAGDRHIRCPDLETVAGRLKDLGLAVQVDRAGLTEDCIVEVEQMIAAYELTT